ncbi:MAG: hypothetical protein IJT09_00520 [Abditibacteriota bacterium]|nr:hypothetical protein [Abditibacteriota bacterium]
MKKLIAVLAVPVIVCGAAFAAFDIDWSGNDNNTNNADDNGFTTELLAGRISRGMLEDYIGSVNPEGSWLLDPNDELTLSIDGIQNMNWSGYDPRYPTNGQHGDGVGLYVFVENPDYPGDFYGVPLEVGDYTSFESFVENGVTITGQNIIDAYHIDSTGRSVLGIGLTVANSYTTANDAGTLKVNLTVNRYGEEEETVVPEPCTIAYALMGLGSIAGIKRRIKK